MLGKYIKIYFWQFISVLLNFGTLFVVTPFLSSNQPLFGIYTIIISLNIFLSYADLGFISAGFKYASESYAKGNKEEETRIIGFVGFVFSIFVGLFMIVVLCFAFAPQKIVNGLNDPIEIQTASYLLVLLAIFSPTFVLQRVLQLVFAVRLEDYHFQRILIISNICKILSTFYFFRPGHYALIEYFLFTQLSTAIAMIAGIILAKKVLGYDVKLLFISFKYSKHLFDKTKKLAFSSIVLTISWILYYQIDPFVIGKIGGIHDVAIYAIGLTFITYIRSLFGILFAPFTARFNHYIGKGDKEGLRNIFINVLVITLPLTVFPVISMFYTTKELVISWVGPDYLLSVPITQYLIICFVFNFIASPAGILIIAYEKIEMIYWTSCMLPVIYWVGVAVTWPHIGLVSFGIFKFVSFTVSGIGYCIISCKLLHIKPLFFLKKVCFPAFLPIVTISVLCLFLKGCIPYGHNKINLLCYIVINGFICFGGFIVYFFSSNLFRNYVINAARYLKLKTLQNK